MHMLPNCDEWVTESRTLWAQPLNSVGIERQDIFFQIDHDALDLSHESNYMSIIKKLLIMQ